MLSGTGRRRIGTSGGPLGLDAYLYTLLAEEMGCNVLHHEMAFHFFNISLGDINGL